MRCLRMLCLSIIGRSPYVVVKSKLLVLEIRRYDIPMEQGEALEGRDFSIRGYLVRELLLDSGGCVLLLLVVP